LLKLVPSLVPRLWLLALYPLIVRGRTADRSEHAVAEARQVAKSRLRRVPRRSAHAGTAAFALAKDLGLDAEKVSFDPGGATDAPEQGGRQTQHQLDAVAAS
jgi:hypothetical protein